MPASPKRAKAKMNLDEIKDLIETVIAKDITEFEFQSGQDKLRICRVSSTPSPAATPSYVFMAPPNAAGAGAVPSMPNSVPPANPPAEPAPAKDPDDGRNIVTAPIVGTFYEASSPGAPPFVQVGDKVEAGQVLCIIEAMKLMNEIEAETGGVISKRFVSNGQPVEYGEALYAIDAR